jgi:hypothetical protein
VAELLAPGHAVTGVVQLAPVQPSAHSHTPPAPQQPLPQPPGHTA